jgi:ATP-dependent Clp protease ATP-binding subunit ClpC
MFEKFTDRSMKVLNLAKNEAIKTKSEVVFTEHILIGCMREESGVAHHCLSNFDLSIKRVRDEIVKLNKSKEQVSDKVDYSPHARELFKNAIDEAEKIGHNYIGTEHLLLSLLANKEFNGYAIMETCGLKTSEVKHYLLNLLGLSLQRYKIRDLKDVDGILDVVDNTGKLISLYQPQTDSLNFWNAVNIPLDDLEEIIEVCKLWKETS